MSGPQAELVSKWHHDKLTWARRLYTPDSIVDALPLIVTSLYGVKKVPKGRKYKEE